ncbi:MAG: hypothetical protein AAB932_02115 [Patescibacteria group bacterium]
MHLTCPECKNDVDLSSYPHCARDTVVECQTCGMSLLMTKVEGDEAQAEIVDEGK